MMETKLIENPIYVVYETKGVTYDPYTGLNGATPIAKYKSYTDMVDAWLYELCSQSHNFYVEETA